MKYCRVVLIWVMLPAIAPFVQAQEKGLVNTSHSQFAKLYAPDMGAVQWTTGFWAERFKICRESMVPHLWDTYNNAQLCHSFKNFEIAAGLDTGNFKGPSFHDGDFYKTLEAVAGLYASTKDPKLDAAMDNAIAVIGKAQRPDGYIYTKAIIEQRKTGQTKMFDDKLSFEAYNFGHLMTAGCVHNRATGKTSLLNIAKKAADFLIVFYKQATPEQARNAICPSHYMGLTELYRATGEKKYLDLADYLINIRGTTEGTDDNSDRAPFRDMKRVAGHAVRANYLFAGAADVYAETGDPTLLATLDRMWDNVVNHKMYVTGGCGALYDGVSVDGTAYKPDTVQKVHQSYGRDYQLPNETAHNETCANIGNVLFNWRMFLVTGEAKYMDVVELTLYNSVLSGISLDGDKFFYTNPLKASNDFPYTMRWSGGRIPYIRLSNCCPPNTVRTIAEVSNYAYSLGDHALFVNLYGSNALNTTFKNGSVVKLKQETGYPWAGTVNILVQQAPGTAFDLMLRIPGWSRGAVITVNGTAVKVVAMPGSYAVVSRSWKAGDRVTLELPMPAELVESNPLVEETRGQVAVKRGPVVYCIESPDMPAGTGVFDVALPANINLKPVSQQIDNSSITALTGNGMLIYDKKWQNELYRPVAKTSKTVPVKLIPYYAWSNRGRSEMSVWIPLAR